MYVAKTNDLPVLRDGSLFYSEIVTYKEYSG
jgi:hypothetical protein